MHEYAICERIIDAASREFADIDPPPARLKSIHVVAGGLHQIIPDYLTFAYEILTRDTPLKGSRMILEISPVVAKCEQCGWEGEIELPMIQCRSCEATGVEVIKGKELYLDKLEIEEEDARPSTS